MANRAQKRAQARKEKIMSARNHYNGIENDAGTPVEFYSEPMEFDGEDWEAVDLEPEPGYALYRDLAATIAKVGNNLGAILQSADMYTEQTVKE